MNNLGAIIMRRKKFSNYPKILKEFMFLMKRKVSLHIRIRGFGDGQFKNPYGIALVITETTWRFCNRSRYRPNAERDENGAYKKKFWSENGNPRGIVVDDNGSVYVSDSSSLVLYLI